MQYEPNQAFILGLDTARKKSGYSMWASCEYVDSGSVTKPEERDYVVKQAVNIAEIYNLPLIIGAEYWTPGMLSYKAYIGIGIGWGYWDDIFQRIKFPKRRIFKVKPNEWRQSILGFKIGKYNKQTAKREAINYCKRHIWDYEKNKNDHDDAEATLIGKYFVYNEKVAKLIKNPNRLKKVEFWR